MALWIWKFELPIAMHRALKKLLGDSCDDGGGNSVNSAFILPSRPGQGGAGNRLLNIKNKT